MINGFLYFLKLAFVRFSGSLRLFICEVLSIHSLIVISDDTVNQRLYNDFQHNKALIILTPIDC
jgi:hypothetical protein